jgi:hypothetical protein
MKLALTLALSAAAEGATLSAPSMGMHVPKEDAQVDLAASAVRWDGNYTVIRHPGVPIPSCGSDVFNLSLSGCSGFYAVGGMSSFSSKDCIHCQEDLGHLAVNVTLADGAYSLVIFSVSGDGYLSGTHIDTVAAPGGPQCNYVLAGKRVWEPQGTNQ